MRYATFACLGLIALVACAADGVSEDNPAPDAGDGQDGGISPGDASDAEVLDSPDAERSLICGKSGLCETKIPASELGEPLSLRSVWVVASNDVWSVSAEGFILHWDGASWTTAYRANHELYSVWGTAEGTWAGGERGLLLHRGTDGSWTRFETGHTKPIRGIFGTGAGDVWFGRDGAVDHFDGSTLTSYPLEVSGLQFKALFGRAGFGTYATYAAGCADCGGESTSLPYVFELTTGGISQFNTALSKRWGFFPVSGVVTDAPDDEHRILLFGYEKAYYGWNFAYTAFGSATPLVRPKPLGGLSVDDPTFKEYPPPPLLPVWGKQWDDIRVQVGLGVRMHWDGSAFTKQSIDMGYDFVPRKVFGIHGNASDTWIVGSGFALKGPTQ